MASNPNLVPIPLPAAAGAKLGARRILREAAANEYVFAVVGHVGSGTSEIAEILKAVMSEERVETQPFEVIQLKSSEVIVEWANANGKPIPPRHEPRELADVECLQRYGNEMRGAKTSDGRFDYSAVARGLIGKIQERRAAAVHQQFEPGMEVEPDGKPRAYILDSIRHPEEVLLLRSVYGEAFLLIGVVCDEERRIQRLHEKYSDAGRAKALELMARDANESADYGQHVDDAVHLADFFVDNTIDRSAGVDWTIPEDLKRLAKIVTHSDLVRPRIAETSMFHAHSAKMRSACLSRQVGAAVVDAQGNLVATGTNEVPRAGGGVYGESFAESEPDHRCAYMKDEDDRFCSNTREQIEIIKDLCEKIPALKSVTDQDELRTKLMKTRIGGLIEFSRAVHAEMDALLSAARKGVSLVGCRLFVTTFPCHYCARHIVAAGIDEVQYVELYPKSKATKLHRDSITVESLNWRPPSEGGSKVLFRPFYGVAPRFYERAFFKDRELKEKQTGVMRILDPEWASPWYLSKTSYVQIEAKLLKAASPIHASVDENARADSPPASPASDG